MFAAQSVSAEDSLLTTLLGFGLLSLFIAVLVAVHVVRWRRRGFAPRLRRLCHRLAAPRGSSTAPSTFTGGQPPALPEVTAANAAAPPMHAAATSPQPMRPVHPARPSDAGADGPTGSSLIATTSAGRRILDARQSPETLEPLAQQVDHTRRLAVAEDRVGNVLGTLARDRWLVERYVLIGGRRVPFLILGETGVFVLWALCSPAQWRDLAFVHNVAGDVKGWLPGYGGPVRGGICRAFAPAIKPRWWCRANEPGAWVMGLDWVIPWVEHFGPDHGLGVTDVERFNTLAGPHWDQPVVRGVPGLPELD
jgi:hypothetical protein